VRLRAPVVVGRERGRWAGFGASLVGYAAALAPLYYYFPVLVSPLRLVGYGVALAPCLCREVGLLQAGVLVGHQVPPQVVVVGVVPLVGRHQVPVVGVLMLPTYEY